MIEKFVLSNRSSFFNVCQWCISSIRILLLLEGTQYSQLITFPFWINFGVKCHTTWGIIQNCVYKSVRFRISCIYHASLLYVRFKTSLYLFLTIINSFHPFFSKELSYCCNPFRAYLETDCRFFFRKTGQLFLWRY